MIEKNDLNYHQDNSDDGNNNSDTNNSNYDMKSGQNGDGEIGENGLQVRFLQDEKYGEKLVTDSVIDIENKIGKNRENSEIFNNYNNINNKINNDINNNININNINIKISKISQNNANKAVLLAGAMAGLAYVLSSHPLEIASILMQIDLPKNRLPLPLTLPLPLPLSLPLPLPLTRVISLSPLKSSLTKISKSTKITEMFTGTTTKSSQYITRNIFKKSGPRIISSVSTVAVAVRDALQTRVIGPIFRPKLRLEYR
jgi:hypothetical protein